MMYPPSVFLFAAARSDIKTKRESNSDNTNPRVLQARKKGGRGGVYSVRAWP